MEFIYAKQMDETICEHERKMYTLCSQIIDEYAHDFAQYGCTLELGYEWSNFLKKYTALKRSPFENGYEYRIYCEVQRKGEIVRYADDEGEVDYYELVSCWSVSSITRRGFKLNVILRDDVSDIREDLKRHLFALKRLG